MIFFGTNSKRLGTAELHEGACAKCGAQAITLTLFQKYVHIFFIPTFPLKKYVQGKCRECGRSYTEDDLPSAFDDKVVAAKRSVKTPPVLFVGLVLFLLIGGYTSYRESVKANESLAYLARPEVHDLYVLPVGIRSSYKYVVCRVEIVQPDSLVFSLGEEAFAFQGGAQKAIDKGSASKEEYFEGEITLARKDVEEMLHDERIKPIVRPVE